MGICIMVKKIKTTLSDQYREILARDGMNFDDCKVVAFEFGSEWAVEIFHFELTYPLRPVYHIFDGWDNETEHVAQLVIPKDAENERALIMLAESCGGIKRTPKL